MPHALSYPAFKSVLEYLEVEERIHLTFRSKFLQRIDKVIPFRANRFYIWGDTLSLDSYRFYLKNTQWINTNGKLLMSYLRGRESRINVDVAVFNTVKSSRDIPVKLDLTINRLKTVYSNLESFLPLINSRSHPLTDLSIVIDGPTNVDYGIVHSAKHVYFGGRGDLIGLEKLWNKSVRFQFLSITAVVGIIRYWIQNGKEVETEFVIPYSTNWYLRKLMANLQEEFRRARDYAEEINEHFLPGFSISLNSTSKLLVYGIEKGVEELVLKVVSSRSTTCVR